MFNFEALLLLMRNAPHALYRGAPLFKSFRMGSKKENLMQIQQVMVEPVFVCNVNDSLNQAAYLMWEHDCGVVPVVDNEGRVVAMLTDRDICMAAYTQGKPLTELSVCGAMSQGVVVCHPDDGIEEAEELMRANRIRRLAVVNGNGQPIGMLSLSDLVRAATHPRNKTNGGLNGIRLTAAARTMAAVCTLRQLEPGPDPA